MQDPPPATAAPARRPDPPALVPSPSTHVRWNAGVHVASETCWGFGWSMLAPTTVLVALLAHLGGGTGTAAILASAGGFQGLLQAVGPWVLRSHRHRMRQILVYHFLTILPAWYIACLGLWLGFHGHDARMTRTLVLAAMVVVNISIGVVAGVWSDWWAHLFDQRVRGTVMGLIAAGVALGLTLGPLLVDQLIRHHEVGALVLLSSASCTLAIAVLVLTRDPASAGPEQAVVSGRALWGWMRQSLRDAHVRWLLCARLLGDAIFSTTAFVVLSYQQAGLSDHVVLCLASAMAAAAALSAIVAGRWGDAHGHRGTLRLGLGLGGAALGCALLLPPALGCWVVLPVLGLAVGVYQPSFFLVHETAPHPVRLAHLIACNLVLAVSNIAVPQGWGLVAQARGARGVEAAALLAAAAALVVALVRVREPRLRAGEPAQAAA